MEKCYEYFGCTKVDCSMHNNRDNLSCWKVEDTLCKSPEIAAIQNTLKGTKFTKCTYCTYRKAVQNK